MILQYSIAVHLNIQYIRELRFEELFEAKLGCCSAGDT